VAQLPQPLAWRRSTPVTAFPLARDRRLEGSIGNWSRSLR
jgi:hypothetical protein